MNTANLQSVIDDLEAQSAKYMKLANDLRDIYKWGPNVVAISPAPRQPRVAHAKPQVLAAQAPQADEQPSVEPTAQAAKMVFSMIQEHQKDAHVWMKEGGGFKVCGKDYVSDPAETLVGVYTVASTEQEIHDDMVAVAPPVAASEDGPSTRGEIIRVLREHPNANANEVYEKGRFNCSMVSIYNELSMMTLRKEWLERVKINGKYAYRVKPGAAIPSYV